MLNLFRTGQSPVQLAKIHENSNHSHTCVVPESRMNESCAQSLNIIRFTSNGHNFFEDGLFFFALIIIVAGHFHNN